MILDFMIFYVLFIVFTFIAKFTNLNELEKKE